MPGARLTRAMAVMGDPARRPGSRAFVGRDRELAELLAGLEDAAGGRRRLFLIAGEPGFGKTWLAEHLAGHATRRGARVLWGRCCWSSTICTRPMTPPCCCCSSWRETFAVQGCWW